MPSAPLLIVGQGLAGTLLAWRCEQAGLDFTIVDAGHAAAASRVGAGIVNPLTGRRIVKSWQVDAWREEALATYRELEAALGVPLLRPMRVRRFFRDAAERAVFEEKAARGDLAPYTSERLADAAGFWIDGAAHVDTGRLIAAARARWLAVGRLREARIDPGEERMPASGRVTVVCGGAACREAFDFVPWELARGQLLTVRLTESVACEVILNCGHWALPLPDGDVRIGATYERGAADLTATPAARAELERSAAKLLGRPFAVVAHETGLRATTPDRRPVAGWHPQIAGLGVLGGLASKGALWAPALARQWLDHVQTGAPFLPAADVARFVRRPPDLPDASSRL
ncbi:MAG TPA: FAD-dependent oxidoreductase [Opitutaceae bacterium]